MDKLSISIIIRKKADRADKLGTSKTNIKEINETNNLNIDIAAKNLQKLLATK